MDIVTFNNLLRTLADGNSIDYAQWPALQARIISRLERICKVGIGAQFDDFTDPPTASDAPSSPPAEPSQVAETSSQVSTSSAADKENAPPPAIDSGVKPNVAKSLNSITSTLDTLFAKHPPHTIQRLAELIIEPKQHYKTINSYLHAVDRVVHVSSGAHVFPLPPAIPDPSSASVLSNGGVDPTSVSWGNPTGSLQNGLGSDESLGGALLTPISWLTNKSHDGNTRSPLEGEVTTESTEMIDGPNGMGGIETVTVSVNGISSTRSPTNGSPPNGTTLRAEGAITQGELLRQEQRAGVVPKSQNSRKVADKDGKGEEDEVPHARGPEEIGMQDVGPQHSESHGQRSSLLEGIGIDIEAATGRKIEPKAETDIEPKPEPDTDEEMETSSTPKREADEELEFKVKRAKTEEKEDVKLENIKPIESDAMETDDPELDPTPKVETPDSNFTDGTMMDEDNAVKKEESKDEVKLDVE